LDTNFVPDTIISHNSPAIPKIRSLNPLFYNSTLIRTSKSAPMIGQAMIKQVRQQNYKAPPSFPSELRVELLRLYQEDILKLERLLDRDLSIWLDDLEYCLRFELTH
jgi:hypothetical protein